MPKQNDPGTVVALRSSSDVEALSELDRMLTDPNAPVPEIEDDPEAIHRQMLAELLSAETDEELESGQAESWRELEGIPIRISGFKWRPSTYEKGFPVFLVVMGERLDDGSRVVLTCGSGAVMAQLSNLARRGRIPGAIRAIERGDKPTKGGFYPLRLVTPEAAKTQGSEAS